MSDVGEVRGAGAENSVQSVDRAVSILQVLGRRGAAGVTELSTELHLHKSTISRLLSTLEARGLVDQAVSRGRYRLAYGVVQLAEGASRQHDLSLSGRPISHALAREIGETVVIAVREGDDVVTIDQAIGSAMVTSVDWVGQRSPLHGSASGKVFLADLATEEVERYAAAGLERYTEHTIVDAANLQAELEVVRKQGYAATHEEQEVGLTAVSAPIRGQDGRVIAALCVTGPTFRLGPQVLSGIVARLLPAATRISERNGYPKVG